jgi:hypothetical protein
MISPFAHPSSVKLLGRVSEVFQSKKVFQRKDRHIVFVCGGSVQLRSRSKRASFLRYSQSSLNNFRIFLAETATKDLSQHEESFINIADFETLIAEVSDCIIIFPESAGSIAEIGFFTNSIKAVKKLLVINDFKKQSDSFINIGLIDKINKKSIFRSTIPIDFSHPEFSAIKDRLISRCPARTAKRLHFRNFSQFDTQQKLYIIFQIVFIFKAMKLEYIIECLSKVFGKVKNRKQIKYLISILIAANYLERKGDDLEYFIPTKTAEPFLEFRNYDINDLQADAVSFFEKYDKETYKVIGDNSR